MLEGDPKNSLVDRDIKEQVETSSKNAIEKGFYLEALVLEYAYIETRVNKIMETLNFCILKDFNEISNFK